MSGASSADQPGAGGKESSSSTTPSGEAKYDLGSGPDSSVSQLIASALAAKNASVEQDNKLPQSAAELPKRPAEDDSSDAPTKRARSGDASTPVVRNVASLPSAGSLASAPFPSSVASTNVSDILRSLTDGQNRNLLAGSAPASGLLLNGTTSMLRPDISSLQLAQEQIARNSAMNNAFLASLGRPNMDSLLGRSQLGSSTSAGLPPQGVSLGFQGPRFQDQPAHLAALFNFAELDALRRSASLGYQLAGPSNALALAAAQGSGARPNSVLQQLVASNASVQDLIRSPPVASVASLSSTSTAAAVAAQKKSSELPPCDENRLEPYYGRTVFPLGVDEDPNWLSESHCFVRSELVEIFRASHEDVKARNNSVVYRQVGLRCCFCAHMIPSARAGRSSAFPSSLRQIYQSFTMMLRDHFGNCDVMPTPIREKFIALKDRPAQGATDSKRYWIYSAMKAGLADSPEGIIINERTMAAGASAPPFGTHPGKPWADDAFRSVPLVLPVDRSWVSEFLYVLMSQVQLIRLTEAERIGNRRSLRVGLPGFACRFCCEKRRLGLCRMFPARRRTLPAKVNDIYDHLRRCTVCPTTVKEQLERTKHQLVTGFNADQGGDREFFDRVWSRLGHGNAGGG